MRNIALFLLTIVFTGLLFAGVINYSFQHIEPKEIPWKAAQGKKVWDYFGCIQCHSLLGNGGYAAPDLTNVVSTRGEEWLRNFFKNPPLMPAGKHKHHKKLTEDQVEILLEYLHMVEEVNTLNWPPPPLRKEYLEVKRIK